MLITGQILGAHPRLVQREHVLFPPAPASGTLHSVHASAARAIHHLRRRRVSLFKAVQYLPHLIRLRLRNPRRPPPSPQRPHLSAIDRSRLRSHHQQRPALAVAIDAVNDRCRSSAGAALASANGRAGRSSARVAAHRGTVDARVVLRGREPAGRDGAGREGAAAGAASGLVSVAAVLAGDVWRRRGVLGSFEAGRGVGGADLYAAEEVSMFCTCRDWV
jgi:hypothetical protein